MKEVNKEKVKDLPDFSDYACLKILEPSVGYGNFIPLLINKYKSRSDMTIDLVDIAEYFNIQNRRFLGNKYKLLGFIEDIVNEKCNGFDSFCDIFAGTGVVGERFNEKNIKVILNDTLTSNYIPLTTFLLTRQLNLKKLKEKIIYLNSIDPKSDNYFSEHYGNTYFTLENASKIGAIREEIDNIAEKYKSFVDKITF